MKKFIGFISITIFCTNSLAEIPVKNNSIPFNKLPIEIKEAVQTNYIEACQSIAEDEEMSVKNPKITFNKGFLVNVDFNGDGLKDILSDLQMLHVKVLTQYSLEAVMAL